MLTPNRVRGRYSTDYWALGTVRARLYENAARLRGTQRRLPPTLSPLETLRPARWRSLSPAACLLGAGAPPVRVVPMQPPADALETLWNLVEYSC